MECPFELPVKFCAYIPVGDSPVDNGYIVDAKGNPIIIPILREQADYIVQAINSHEKFKTALEKIENARTVTGPTDERLNVILELKETAKQALKEAEKK